MCGDGERARPRRRPHPLHWAAAHTKCIELLLMAGADDTATDAQGRTAVELASALRQGHAQALLTRGVPLADPKVVDGENAISMLSFLAALDKRAHLAALLRPGGLDPNRKDEDGDRAPLHWAAARGNLRCVELLLAAGADLGRLDATGATAARLALELKQRDTMRSDARVARRVASGRARLAGAGATARATACASERA